MTNTQNTYVVFGPQGGIEFTPTSMESTISLFQGRLVSALLEKLSVKLGVLGSIEAGRELCRHRVETIWMQREKEVGVGVLRVAKVEPLFLRGVRAIEAIKGLKTKLKKKTNQGIRMRVSQNSTAKAACSFFALEEFERQLAD